MNKTKHMKVRPLIGALLAVAACTGQVHADGTSVDDFDVFEEAGLHHDPLFNPSKESRERELAGRVLIYDGLEEASVDKAMDMHFDRIEHMMFLRVKAAPKEASGNKKTQSRTPDDDC